MLSVHWRLAELWTLQQKRKLTEDEESEMTACLHYNAIYARKLSGLYNLSLAASMINDAEWQHEICQRIEKLESQGVSPEFK
ncbi:hypothetical protein N0M98_24610 [Paenibacillus doosanensis]|uniref:Uncharacterized protein n=1 Tax=Paenibacillus konkukensis TaxID=2020716 RepID=A0ABY4S3B0_9BACL|nr:MULTISPECIES: hypothetical protein [Paenibacillus]MCS7463310.1 hypothetical protein [Paenibacillus doosanensis]UQZ87614.1 hypothetical protein SK3146_06916 [Paenibacillus konkukensis]